MFNVDDPLNAPTADMYGIVQGTSHTEPLMRATKEQSLFLNGIWSWTGNQANVTTFMEAGAERAASFDSIYTMGMRGLGDTASPTLNASELEQIITVEQQILRKTFNTSDITNIPQMWCLYKVGFSIINMIRVVLSQTVGSRRLFRARLERPR